MFSIIIPLYNKANYIEKAVHSVLNQTFQDFELIIINDGSTDNSLEKTEQFTHEKITIIHQANCGVSETRNKGVRLAKHELIAFLDADDWWDKDFLAEMYRLISEFSDAGLYGCNYYIVKNGRNIEATIGINKDFSLGYIDYFSVYAATFWVPLNCSFVVIKKTVFQELNGFNPKLKFGEDLDLWIRVALKYKVAYLNQFLAFSNQDVVVSNRALGTQKQWKKEEHISFNLDKYKNQNATLDYLIDGLKLRSLTDFYLQNKYPNEVQELLKNISFSEHPYFFRFIYHYPKYVVKSYFKFKKMGSILKQSILKK